MEENNWEMRNYFHSNHFKTQQKLQMTSALISSYVQLKVHFWWNKPTVFNFLRSQGHCLTCFKSISLQFGQVDDKFQIAAVSNVIDKYFGQWFPTTKRTFYTVLSTKSNWTSQSLLPARESGRGGIKWRDSETDRQTTQAHISALQASPGVDKQRFIYQKAVYCPHEVEYEWEGQSAQLSTTSHDLATNIVLPQLSSHGAYQLCATASQSWKTACSFHWNPCSRYFPLWV